MVLHLVFLIEISNDKCSEIIANYENALTLYFKFVKGITTKVRVFNYLFKNDLIKYLENIIIGDKMYFFSLNYALNPLNVLEELKNISEDSFTKYNIAILNRIIKKEIFHKLVKDFSHGKKGDLVNSPIGLIKVCFDNEFKIRDTLIKNNRAGALTLLGDFNKELKSLEEFTKYKTFRDEIWLLQDKTEKIISYFEKGKGEQEKQEELSKHIYYIFNFISKYAKQ